MVNTDLLDAARQHSVTKNDETDRFNGGFYFIGYHSSGNQDGLPQYWSFQRDFYLRGTIRMESMWASAIYKAISMQASLGWSVEDSDDSSARTRRFQQLILWADGFKASGRGWGPFIQKHLNDVMLTDNGGFVEVIRSTAAAGSRVEALGHLDSARCERTGDAKYPVLYRDRMGREHALRDYQVFSYADMPNPEETYNGVGFCAASRAWSTILKMAAIERFILEKVTGSRPTAIHLVSGISQKGLDMALRTADQNASARGESHHKGVILIPMMQNEKIETVTIPISEIPDGFDAKTERDDAYLRYANAIGVPVQDIQPLSGQGLGSGTQSVILAEAAQGQGLAAWRKWWEQSINEYVLPETTTFSFATNDIRDKRAMAEVAQMRAATRKTQIESGEITAQQALQMAADAGDVPREFLANDATAGGMIADDEKPVSSENDGTAVAPPAPPTGEGPQAAQEAQGGPPATAKGKAPAPSQPAPQGGEQSAMRQFVRSYIDERLRTKEVDDTDVTRLIAQEMAGARALYRAVAEAETEVV